MDSNDQLYFFELFYLNMNKIGHFENVSSFFYYNRNVWIIFHSGKIEFYPVDVETE
jgi:hypothetical protein